MRTYRWGADVSYTPMIIAENFVKSIKARDNEFSTDSCKLSMCHKLFFHIRLLCFRKGQSQTPYFYYLLVDFPTVVQFAAKDAAVFAEAASIAEG